MVSIRPQGGHNSTELADNKESSEKPATLTWAGSLLSIY